MTIPRSILLPNFLQGEPWRDLMDAVDFVWKDRVDDPVTWITQLREKYLLSPEVLDAAVAGNLVSESALHAFDRETRLQSIAMSGLRIPESDKFLEGHYERLQRELSTYWYSKGTGSVVDFIAYVLNVPVSMSVLWTEDYVNFFVEGNPSIGSPVYEGGTWYPTTHVQLAYDQTSAPGVPLSTLLSLFYSLCNYNLVVGQIALDLFLSVAQANESPERFPAFKGSKSIALGLYYEVEVAMIGVDDFITLEDTDVVASTEPVVNETVPVII